MPAACTGHENASNWIYIYIYIYIVNEKSRVCIVRYHHFMYVCLFLFHILFSWL